jgi:uncharacterized phage protein gp47/JayE
MAFNKDSLQVLKERTLANYLSLFKPLDKTPRHSLISVMANVDAGLAHLLQGDLVFLSRQLFPDTAEGDFLRAHWASRVPPLYAVAAVGIVEVSGNAGVSLPAGTVFKSSSGKRYFTERSYNIADNGKALVYVKAETVGADSNLQPESRIAIVSAIPSVIDSNAIVGESGIGGGADAESDEAYLVRVLNTLKNSVRYGKSGDFEAWAMDATPEVSKAWEYKNFGVFGALLIQVISGNQFDGVFQVANLAAVRDYINAIAPPCVFTVRTPELICLNPAIELLSAEDNVANRGLIINRIKNFLQMTSKPGIQYTSGMIRNAFIDGIDVTSGVVKLNGDINGMLSSTVLQLPVFGDVTWE